MNITRDRAFEIWAPAGAIWSPWAKPVLLAHLDELTAEERSRDAGEAARTIREFTPPENPQRNCAIVADLPGESGVWFGLHLASAGYRPVPLYNAAPEPLENPLTISVTSVACVPVRPILLAMSQATRLLAELSIPTDAPPVFLLDARRRGGLPPQAGQFDNRSVSFPSDFPSAHFLRSHGIDRALLVQENTPQPQADVAQALLRWQQGGIAIFSQLLAAPADQPQPLIVKKPSQFRWLMHDFLARLGLTRNPLGGYGGLLQESHAAGG